MSVSVNGTEIIASLEFETTPDWTTWRSKEILLSLPQGASTIIMKSMRDQGGPNLDKITIHQTTTPAAMKSPETEAASIHFSNQNLVKIQAGTEKKLYIELYTLDGKRVFSRMLQRGTIDHANSLSLKNMGKGTFLLKVKSGNFVQTRFIVTKKKPGSTKPDINSTGLLISEGAPMRISKIQLATLIVLGLISFSFAARMVEKLDRGLVAVTTGTNKVFLSWRLKGYESQNLGFNIYRNGTKINSSPITGGTNYTDNSGSSTASYKVCAVLNGMEIDSSTSVIPWGGLTKRIPLNRPAGGTTPDNVAYTYSPNDCSLGDLDGDGQWEIILKWDPSNAKDNSQSGYTGNVYIDGIKLDGTRLWRIDLGKNIRAGAHYTQFLVADFDLDGKAELICKTAPGTKDATGNYISKGAAASASHTTDYRNSSGYVLSGPEYLTVFSGEGKELATDDYIPGRGSVSSWGDNYGNRVDRFLAAVAYLDGVRPSAVMQRGYYTRMTLTAWNWDGSTLTQKWAFDSNTSGNGSAAGQGNHNLSVADVDADGFDEIIQGSSAINHDGKLMYATGIGHGDAIHLSDLDPDRPGLEVMSPHEEKHTAWPGTEVHDAKTGDNIWKFLCDNVDVGRGMAADIDLNHRGFEVWSSNTDGFYNIKGTRVSTIKPTINFRIYWDGDLADELLDGIGSAPSAMKIEKWNGSGIDRLVSTDDRYGSYVGININGTKSNPCLVADILGDWREELILRESGDNALVLYTTTVPSTHRLYTLMHDPVYRAAVAWQNVAYNQPPHLGFYIGDGLDNVPIPDIQPVNGASYDCAGVENGTATLDQCGRCTGGVTGQIPCSGAVQFEDNCNANGTIDNNNTGFLGTGFLNLANATGSDVTMSVAASETGEYALYVRFANGSTANRPVSIEVNGATLIPNLDMPATGSWTTWESITFSLNLQQGNNLIRFISLTENGAANLDLIGFATDKLSAGNCLTTGAACKKNIMQKSLIIIAGDKMMLSGFDNSCEVRITDLQGRMLLQQRNTSPVIPLSKLSKGTFLVQVLQKGAVLQEMKTVRF